MPVSYELTPANTPEVLLTEELLDAAGLGGGTARRLFGDLAYRSGTLAQVLAGRGVLLATERADRRPATRQQVEVCFATLRARLQDGRDVGKDAGRVSDQDRRQGHSLHLWLLRQPLPGETTGMHQGTVGLKNTQHSSSGFGGDVKTPKGARPLYRVQVDASDEEGLRELFDGLEEVKRRKKSITVETRWTARRRPTGSRASREEGRDTGRFTANWRRANR